MFDLLESTTSQDLATAYTGRGLTSRLLKHREGAEFDTSKISIYDVVDPYAKSLLRTIHDLPAVHTARERVVDIQDSDIRTLTNAYLDNYEGQSLGMNKWLERGGRRMQATKEVSTVRIRTFCPSPIENPSQGTLHLSKP